MRSEPSMPFDSGKNSEADAETRTDIPTGRPRRVKRIKGNYFHFSWNFQGGVSPMIFWTVIATQWSKLGGPVSCEAVRPWEEERRLWGTTPTLASTSKLVEGRATQKRDLLERITEMQRFTSFSCSFPQLPSFYPAFSQGIFTCRRSFPGDEEKFLGNIARQSNHRLMSQVPRKIATSFANAVRNEGKTMPWSFSALD